MQICGHDVANKRNGKQAQKPMQLQSRKSDLDADFEIYICVWATIRESRRSEHSKAYFRWRRSSAIAAFCVLFTALGA